MVSNNCQRCFTPASRSGQAQVKRAQFRQQATDDFEVIAWDARLIAPRSENSHATCGGRPHRCRPGAGSNLRKTTLSVKRTCWHLPPRQRRREKRQASSEWITYVDLALLQPGCSMLLRIATDLGTAQIFERCLVRLSDCR